MAIDYSLLAPFMMRLSNKTLVLVQLPWLKLIEHDYNDLKTATSKGPADQQGVPDFISSTSTSALFVWPALKR